mmetsp:Transcript_7180/g.8094  ORF Transcript_7180/g.8094 Transcript_7180/m.8094 type:complete len:99 (-) Transcript_7180:129-425(-)|eukprot:CAMPEP_0205815952 /NCGR_PEP_ID=MMETSP0205-20121125/21942_1 /ASSEMBLY_ACC=CAM_ASM_000278 /TAXON_ID=36767 /ORGANISM="Euplotes focardii, Strain TN1" /LENGTH=98 /DNA_ID=CAMNT_0053103217 /DNA_START=278 /DNA_END=574 /DNA_ORIENTATION=+
MKVFRQTGEVETKIMMKRKTKDPSNLESFPDYNTDIVPQVAQNEGHPISPNYYSSGYTPCQLPTPNNMDNEFFIPERFSEEEKVIVHCNLFGSEEYTS